MINQSTHMGCPTHPSLLLTLQLHQAVSSLDRATGLVLWVCVCVSVCVSLYDCQVGAFSQLDANADNHDHTDTHTHTHTFTHLQPPRVRSRRNWQFQINAPSLKLSLFPKWSAPARLGPVWSALAWLGLAPAWPGRSAIVPKMGLQLEFAFSQATTEQPKAAPTAPTPSASEQATPSLIVAQVAIAAAAATAAAVAAARAGVNN